MVLSINQAVSEISLQLSEAFGANGGVSKAQVQKITDGVASQLSNADAKQLVRAFTQQSFFVQWDDSRFESMLGVSKKDLVTAMQTSVGNLRSAGGVTSLAGADLAVHQMKNAKVSQQTLNNVNRFFTSPLPGEHFGHLARILSDDAALTSFGPRAMGELTASLMETSHLVPADKLLNAFVASGGKTGPSPKTLAAIEQELMEEGMQPGRAIAKLIGKDRWLGAMIDATPGASAKGLADYLMPVSEQPLSRLLVQYFNPEGNARKAEVGVDMLNDMLVKNGLYMLRDLPPPEKMTTDDAEFIASCRVNDFSLEKNNNGRYTIVARTFDQNVTDGQVTQALRLLVGDRGVDVRPDRGESTSAADTPAATTDAAAHLDPRAAIKSAVAALTIELATNGALAALVRSIEYTSGEGIPMVGVKTQAADPNDKEKNMIEQLVAQAMRDAGFGSLLGPTLGNTIQVVGKDGGFGL